MNKSVYIESSVISYLTTRPSRDLVIAGHQAVTAEWWDERRLQYDVYVSPLVVEEISAGDASAAEERLDCSRGRIIGVCATGIKCCSGK